MNKKRTPYNKNKVSTRNLKFEYGGASGYLNKKITSEFLKKCVFVDILSSDNKNKPDISRNYYPKHGKVHVWYNDVDGIFQSEKTITVLDAVREINMWFKMGYRIRYYIDKMSINRVLK